MSSMKYLNRHLEGCKLNEKRYKKLCSILNDIRKKTRSAEGLIEKFADKCYGKEPDRSKAEYQATQFLEALFGSSTQIVSLGPEKAMQNKLDTLYGDTEDEKAREKRSDKGLIKAIPLSRNQKSEKFNVLIHGKQLKKGNIEESPIWTMKLDRFLVGPTLGVGGTATVKLAWDTKAKKQIALKILQPKYAFSAQAEIDILKKLKHDNIIQIYDCFDNVLWDGNRTTVFAIEYADGGELIEYLMYTAKFESDLARWFFHKLIAGMEYCHKQNIVHRDLKHDNCLLGGDFNLKITDFGFARYYYKDDKQQMKTAIGTAQYAAPEILAQKKYNEKVDVFSMGVMLFIALAGSQPWRKADPGKDRWYYMAYKGKWGDFWEYHKRSHGFSSSAKELLRGLLSHNPKDRWSINDIKRSDWYNDQSRCSDDKAMKRMKKRKREMDQKKFDKCKHTAGTRKKINMNLDNLDEDDKKLMAKADPPIYDMWNLPLTSFYTKENAVLVLEYVKGAINSLKGSVKSENMKKFEITFEVKSTLNGMAKDDPEILGGKVNIYKESSEAGARNVVVFLSTNSFQRMQFPGLYNDLMDHVAFLRADVADDEKSE